ncbi:hypothetical protein NC653_028703 [Populus alba x Populus x berolinensis]|uniref:Uncharacterized protein n=1 Tax=Populus alba x Populus x berolinensis TaxID=444605 RepID=A0AAD6M0E3_9ROSI|nr:hypothetical protein NC653_028703 [Populus alba x Populus x berolinensis]
MVDSSGDVSVGTLELLKKQSDWNPFLLGQACCLMAEKLLPTRELVGAYICPFYVVFGGKREDRASAKWFVAMVSGRLGRRVTVVIGGICWGNWSGLVTNGSIFRVGGCWVVVPVLVKCTRLAWEEEVENGGAVGSKTAQGWASRMWFLRLGLVQVGSVDDGEEIELKWKASGCDG